MLYTSLSARRALFYFTLVLSVLSLSLSAANAKKRKRARVKFAKKGTITISGGLSIQSLSETPVEKGDEVTDGDQVVNRSGFLISPRVGYFVFSNRTLAVEAAGQIGFGSSSSERDGTEGPSASTMELGLDVPVYFKMLRKNKIYPFAHVAFLRRSQSSKAGKGADEVDLSGNQIRVGAGIALALGKREGGFFKLSLDYLVQNQLLNDKDNGNNTTGIDIGAGFGLFF